MEESKGISMGYATDDLLLVEDNPSDAELTLYTLQKNGMASSVRVLDDGEEALDYLFCQGKYQDRRLTDRPRLILLDLKLPKVSGLQVLKAIRDDSRTRAIPVVIHTSSKEPKDLSEGYKLGASAFIQKPVDFDRFRQTVLDIGAFWLRANEPPPAEAFLTAASE
jgi:two-component system response regulator